MPGTLVDSNAMVICQHSGQAKPLIVNPQVKLSGASAITQASTYGITGCSNLPQAGGPCISAQWITAATRVFVAGLPVLLNTSTALTTPPGRQINILSTQQRVTGQ